MVAASCRDKHPRRAAFSPLLLPHVSWIYQGGGSFLIRLAVKSLNFRQQREEECSAPYKEQSWRRALLWMLSQPVCCWTQPGHTREEAPPWCTWQHIGQAQGSPVGRRMFSSTAASCKKQPWRKVFSLLLSQPVCCRLHQGGGLSSMHPAVVRQVKK